MKQVTAVEWLVEQLSSSKYIYNLMEEIECQSTIVQPNIFEQAKAMEKKQLIDAYSNNGWNDEDLKANAEQYYNETYKKTI
jgi:hypothetical protein